jgi:hypothetical protein
LAATGLTVEESKRLVSAFTTAYATRYPAQRTLTDAYNDVLRPPQKFIGPESQMTQIQKSVSEFDKPQPIPDARVMLNVDLMKLKSDDLVRHIKSIFRQDGRH